MPPDTITPAAAVEMPKPVRLVSIDALRGLVMALMAFELLGNPQWLTETFPDSRICEWIACHAVHVAWRGCSLHDLIQPTFSLLVGVSCAYSIASRRSKGHGPRGILLHAFWRALVLVALGVWVRSLGAPMPNWTFEDTLAQIGLGYVPLVWIALTFKPRGVIALASGLMAGYWLLFACWPLPDGASGFASHWTPAANPAQAFDRWFLPHFPGKETYYGNGYGVLNFIPTLGTMLIGLAAGLWLRACGNDHRRMLRLLLPTALTLLAAGWLLDVSGVCPMIKRIWTLSFALWSGGLALTAREALERRLEDRLQAETAGPLVILNADYGVRGDPDARADVTAAVAKAVEENSLRLEITNDLLGGTDPAPGRDKHLTVSYTVAGQSRRATAPEYATLTLPAAPTAAGVLAKRLPPLFAAACELLAIWLILLWLHRRRIYLKI